MSLTFCNRHTAPLSLCILWWTPGCPDGGDWSKAGWWNLSPGGCATVLVGDLANRWYYVHAEAADRLWQGNVHTTVPYTAFDWCENTSSTAAHDAGFATIDTGDYSGFTVNLT